LTRVFIGRREAPKSMRLLLRLLAVCCSFAASGGLESSATAAALGGPAPPLVAGILRAVAEQRSPAAAAALFCDEGVLVGAGSRAMRTGAGIREYFEWLLAAREGLRYDADVETRVTGDNIAHSLVKWSWLATDGSPRQATARMSLVAAARATSGPRSWCIQLLHSSAMPDDPNAELAAASDASQRAEASDGQWWWGDHQDDSSQCADGGGGGGSAGSSSSSSADCREPEGSGAGATAAAATAGYTGGTRWVFGAPLYVADVGGMREANAVLTAVIKEQVPTPANISA
jgi:hypothetical protein